MVKGNNRHDHRRQPHNGFRPKNKGGTKNQEVPLGTKTPEATAHSEKPRRRQHASDNSEARPFRGNVSRVSQCNLCPTRIEVSTDAAVLSVPAVTLVAWARREKSSFHSVLVPCPRCWPNSLPKESQSEYTNPIWLCYPLLIIFTNSNTRL